MQDLPHSSHWDNISHHNSARPLIHTDITTHFHAKQAPQKLLQIQCSVSVCISTSKATPRVVKVLITLFCEMPWMVSVIGIL